MFSHVTSEDATLAETQIRLLPIIHLGDLGVINCVYQKQENTKQPDKLVDLKY